MVWMANAGRVLVGCIVARWQRCWRIEIVSGDVCVSGEEGESPDLGRVVRRGGDRLMRAWARGRRVISDMIRRIEEEVDERVIVSLEEGEERDREKTWEVANFGVVGFVGGPEYEKEVTGYEFSSTKKARHFVISTVLESGWSSNS